MAVENYNEAGGTLLLLNESFNIFKFPLLGPNSFGLLVIERIGRKSVRMQPLPPTIAACLGNLFVTHARFTEGTSRQSS